MARSINTWLLELLLLLLGIHSSLKVLHSRTGLRHHTLLSRWFLLMFSGCIHHHTRLAVLRMWNSSGPLCLIWPLTTSSAIQVSNPSTCRPLALMSSSVFHSHYSSPTVAYIQVNGPPSVSQYWLALNLPSSWMMHLLRYISHSLGPPSMPCPWPVPVVGSVGQTI